MRREELYPNTENASLKEVEVAMDCAPKKRVYIRLSAIRFLFMGFSLEETAKLVKVSLRSVQLWVNRFNRGGIDALVNRPIPGRPRKIEIDKLAEQLLPVIKDPELEGQYHWTGKKIHGYLKERFKVELSYETCIKYLHELDINLRYPRKWPEQQDESKRNKFLKEIGDLQQQKNVSLWFSDECGIEGDPRPRRRWVIKGSKPKIPYHGTHIRNNVIGAVNPKTGEFISFIFDGCNTAVFQFFLDEMAKTISHEAEHRHLIVLDNASWHKAKSLNWHHFEPIYLPPYSPDFNPIERLWLNIKAKFFADFIARTPEQLVERICDALKYYFSTPENISSICSFAK